MKIWPTSAIALTLDPPLACKQPGRPKKTRKRDKDEGNDGGHKLRKVVVMHCRKCGNTGTMQQLVLLLEMMNKPQMSANNKVQVEKM